MTLDENVKRELSKDYRIVGSLISNIVFAGRNGTVSDADYLRPTCKFNQQLPLDNKGSEFYYFTTIRIAIEHALLTGKIPKGIGEELLPQFPDYLMNLVEK